MVKDLAGWGNIGNCAEKKSVNKESLLFHTLILTRTPHIRATPRHGRVAAPLIIGGISPYHYSVILKKKKISYSSAANFMLPFTSAGMIDGSLSIAILTCFMLSRSLTVTVWVSFDS
jgi:hypothetical protein